MGVAAGIAAGVGVASSVVGAKKQKSAGKEAEKIAAQNAANTGAETDETVRRTQESQDQILSASKARHGGSGFKTGGGGSFDVYMSEMESTFKSDIDWIKKSGASKESVERAQGRVASKQATASAWGTVASGATSLMSFWK